MMKLWIYENHSAVHKPTQNPLQSCISLGLISGSLRYAEEDFFKEAAQQQKKKHDGHNYIYKLSAKTQIRSKPFGIQCRTTNSKSTREEWK